MKKHTKILSLILAVSFLGSCTGGTGGGTGGIGGYIEDLGPNELEKTSSYLHGVGEQYNGLKWDNYYDFENLYESKVILLDSVILNSRTSLENNDTHVGSVRKTSKDVSGAQIKFVRDDGSITPIWQNIMDVIEENKQGYDTTVIDFSIRYTINPSNVYGYKWTYAGYHYARVQAETRPEHDANPNAQNRLWGDIVLKREQLVYQRVELDPPEETVNKLVINKTPNLSRFYLVRNGGYDQFFAPAIDNNFSMSDFNDDMITKLSSFGNPNPNIPTSTRGFGLAIHTGEFDRANRHSGEEAVDQAGRYIVPIEVRPNIRFLKEKPIEVTKKKI